MFLKYKILNIFKLKYKFFSTNFKIKKNLIKNIKYNFKNIYKLKIYIKKGGCNGFKYNFIKELFIKKFNIIIKKKIYINLDTISKICFINSILNFILIGKKSNFLIKSKIINEKCNCGISFKIN